MSAFADLQLKLDRIVCGHSQLVGWFVVIVLLVMLFMLYKDWKSDWAYSKALKAVDPSKKDEQKKSNMASYMGAATAVNFATMDLRGSAPSSIGSCGKKGIIEDIQSRGAMQAEDEDAADQKVTPPVKAGFLSQSSMKQHMGNKRRMVSGPLRDSDLAAKLEGNL